MKKNFIESSKTGTKKTETNKPRKTVASKVIHGSSINVIEKNIYICTVLYYSLQNSIFKLSLIKNWSHLHQHHLHHLLRDSVNLLTSIDHNHDYNQKYQVHDCPFHHDANHLRTNCLDSHLSKLVGTYI